MRKTTIVAMAIIAIVIIGLVYLLFFGGISVKGVDLYVDLGKITTAETPIETILYIDNRYPLSVNMRSGGLRISINELNLVNVDIPSQGLSQGLNNFTVHAVLNNMLLDDFWYQHLSRGEKSEIIIEGSIVIDTPVRAIDIPIRFSSSLETQMFPVEQELNREYGVDPLGKVVAKSIKVDFAGVTPDKTKLFISIVIENKLKVPLYISGIVFRVRSSGGVILGEGEQVSPKSIAPNEIDTITFEAYIDNTKIPSLWHEHIKNKEKSKIYIEIWLKANIDRITVELFKEVPLTIPIEFETNIFKYK